MIDTGDDMKKTNYFMAYLDDVNKVNVYLSMDSYGGKSDRFYIEREEDHYQIPLKIVHETIDKGYHKYECEFQDEFVFGKSYVVFHQYARSTPLICAGVVKTSAFDEKFYYEGNDLGCVYTRRRTTFKLWAPTAYRVWLHLEHNGHTRMLEMQRDGKGVYSVGVDNNLLGATYVYYVEVNGEINVTIDPYAKASTANSQRSVVCDLNSIYVRNYPLPKMESYCDAIIYEASIRDYTTIGTIRSFIHSGHNSVLSYIKELGATHIQLLPVMDFKSVDDLDVARYYNWGYDPYQWMAFENSYSSNVYDPVQVMRDFAMLVENVHRHGLRVNLDVVFNHVYDRDNSSLQLSVPYYYFQFDPNRGYSNASMCGNDIDTTRLMCRKLIVNTCEYLAGKYRIDGLRFDLMGILDITTMNEIVKATKKINPDFMIYGEGWHMNSFLAEEERASQVNAWKIPQIAHFSDRFRDTVKGSTDMNRILDLGYMLGDTNKIYQCMNVLGGSTQDIGNSVQYENANQCINYVECHDNQTSWDKIDEAINRSTKIKKLHHCMLIAAVMLAQGIPFIHGGQEFCRSKSGLPNTYNAPDNVNKINWIMANQNRDVINYTKDLIRLRKRYSCLRQWKGEEIRRNVSYQAIHNVVLRYQVKDENDELLIFFNPTYTMYPYVVESGYEMIFYNALLREAEYPTNVDIYGLSVVVFHRIND